MGDRVAHSRVCATKHRQALPTVRDTLQPANLHTRCTARTILTVIEATSHNQQKAREAYCNTQSLRRNSGEKVPAEELASSRGSVGANFAFRE